MVSIYNRWGDLVWSGKNYDNVNVVWEGKNKNGQDLPDATYFYLVEIPDKTYKGWVELTH
jgi:gliding motility-associated-like protein